MPFGLRRRGKAMFRTMLRRTAVLWVLLAATIGLAFAGSFVSPFYALVQAQQVEHPDTPASEERDTISLLLQRLSTIWAGTLDNPVVFYTFILAIFTALL